MAYAGRAVAPNQDGRLEVVVTNPSGITSHLWQETPSGAWNASPAAFPGTVHTVSFPAVVRHFDGRLDVFVITSAGTVAHSLQAAPNVNWEPWADVGGSLRPDGVAANIDPMGQTFLAAVGKDGAVWYTYQDLHVDPLQDARTRVPSGESGPTGAARARRERPPVPMRDKGSFAEWKSLGGNFKGAPSIALNADGRLEIFAVSSSGELLHAWQASGSHAFGPWVSMGAGPFTGSPAVARNLDQRLEVFVTMSSGALAHAWQLAPNGGWSAFDQPPGTHAHDATVAMNADGTLEIFVVGVTDGALWHRRQVAPNTGWGEWTSLGGVVGSTPAVARNSDGTLEVLAVGQDGALWQTHQASAAGATWTPWARVGGQVQPGIF